MKKVLSIISAILLLFVVGCSPKEQGNTNSSENTSNVTESNKNEESSKNSTKSDANEVETTTFYTEKNGVELEVKFYHKGDKVLKQIAYNVMDYKKMGVTKEQFIEYDKPIMEKYRGIEGLEQKVDFQDDKAYETVTVDYTKVDKFKLIGIPGATVDTTTTDVSLKKNEYSLLSQGYIKVNKN